MNWPESSTVGSLGDGRLASAADRPDTLEDLRSIVARRIGEGLALYPQGGRTALDYGGIPRSPGVALSTLGLNRVIDYPAADMTITAEAGMTLKALQDIVGRENQRLTLDAPQADQATLGGLYATNFSGPRRFGCGRPRDQIIGISYVNAQGEVIKGGGRVVKNVAGYDLPKLLTGSLGTLGIIAQLTLKVRPKPESNAIAWVGFKQLDEVQSALSRLNTSDSRPVAIELLNRPAAIRIARTSCLPVSNWTLAIGLEDNRASVSWQIDRLRNELTSQSFHVRQDHESANLWSSLIEFADEALGPLAIVVNLPVAEAVGFTKSLEPGRWAVQGHAGNGILRPQYVAEPAALGPIAGEIASLRREASRFGGSVVLSRCPTDWKETLQVWGDKRPDWVLSERVKKTLDPAGVLNPGRFIGSI